MTIISDVCHIICVTCLIENPNTSATTVFWLAKDLSQQKLESLMTDAITDSKFNKIAFTFIFFSSLYCHVSKFMEKYSGMKVSAKQLFNFLSRLWSVFPWEFEVKRIPKFKHTTTYLPTHPPTLTIRKCPASPISICYSPSSSKP